MKNLEHWEKWVNESGIHTATFLIRGERLTAITQRTIAQCLECGFEMVSSISR